MGGTGAQSNYPELNECHLSRKVPGCWSVLPRPLSPSFSSSVCNQLVYVLILGRDIYLCFIWIIYVVMVIVSHFWFCLFLNFSNV